LNRTAQDLLSEIFEMAVTEAQINRVGCTGRRARRKMAASVQVYQGALTFLIAASGLLTSAIAAGANRFGGVATENCNNSAGGAGALQTETITDGTVTLVNVVHSLVDADIGKLIYASDNYSVTITSTNNVLIGMLEDIDPSGDPVISLKSF
jgi:hypothetical protein